MDKKVKILSEEAKKYFSDRNFITIIKATNIAAIQKIFNEYVPTEYKAAIYSFTENYVRRAVVMAMMTIETMDNI